MVPSRNLTVRAVPVAATAVAASRADAPDKATNEPSATQRSLNTRRLSHLVSLPFTTPFLRVRARSEDRSIEFHSASLAAKIGSLLLVSQDMAEYLLPWGADAAA